MYEYNVRISKLFVYCYGKVPQGKLVSGKSNVLLFMYDIFSFEEERKEIMNMYICICVYIYIYIYIYINSGRTHKKLTIVVNCSWKKTGNGQMRDKSQT